MKVTIVIVNYNDKERTDNCVRSILRYPPHIPFEIMVVDNASGDGSVEYLQERWENHEDIRFIANKKNAGFGTACNQAIKQTKSIYVAVLNPDIEVRENTFNRLIEYMNNNPEVGIVGPQLVYEDGLIQDSYRRFPRFIDIVIKRTFLKNIPLFRKRMQEYLLWTKDKEKVESVDWLVGAFWMIRRTALDRVGLFDPRFFLFFEDVDLCRRMHRAGYDVVYVPTAKATHRHQRLSEGGLRSIFSSRMVRIHITSGVQYFLKWFGKK